MSNFNAFRLVIETNEKKKDENGVNVCHNNIYYNISTQPPTSLKIFSFCGCIARIIIRFLFSPKQKIKKKEKSLYAEFAHVQQQNIAIANQFV